MLKMRIRKIKWRNADLLLNGIIEKSKIIDSLKKCRRSGNLPNWNAVSTLQKGRGKGIGIWISELSESKTNCFSSYVGGSI